MSGAPSWPVRLDALEFALVLTSPPKKTMAVGTWKDSAERVVTLSYPPFWSMSRDGPFNQLRVSHAVTRPVSIEHVGGR